MRTTIRLDDTLLRQAKAMAATNGRSLNEFIVDAVRAAVARRAPRSAVPLPTFNGNGLQPGVDLDDSASLLDIMDGATIRFGQSAAAPARKVAEGSPPKSPKKR